MSNKCIDKDYFTIKEFADLVGVPETILRHYDNNGYFPAAKRGNGNNSNYRNYHPADAN